MPAKYEKVIAVELKVADAAFVISSSMKRLGWDSLYVNEVMKTITGRLARRMTMAGLNWNYDFHMTVRWQEAEEGISVELSLEERTYSHGQPECAKLTKAFEEALIEDVLTATEASRIKQEGARWATLGEIEKAGYLGELDDHRQLVVAQVGEQWLRLPVEGTNRHALVCGPTGSGKTTGIFIPNLIERTKSSAIVTEATGAKGVADLFQKTAGYRKACGQKIYYFNPDDLSSSRINPLDRVRTIRQAWRVVEIIMQTTTMSSHRGDQSWELSERLLLAALIMHVVGERERGRCNLGYVAELLEEGPDALEDVVGRSKVPFARRFYNTFWKNSTDKYRNLVAAGLVSRLKVFYYPTIRELTSTTDVPFGRLNQELFTMYISVAADNHELKPVAALMLNLALGVVAEGKSRYPLMLMLDEFTNFGYIRGFPSKLTIMRHDGVPVVLGVQDLVQLDNTYANEAKTLRSQPSTRIFFKPNDPDTAVILSKALGEYTKEESTVTSSGQIQKHRDRKMLLTADELLNLGAVDERGPEEQLERPSMIVFLPKTRPALLYAANWKDYAEQCNPDEYPPPRNPERAVDDELLEGRAEVVEEVLEGAQSPEVEHALLPGPGPDPVDEFIARMREQALASDTWQYPKIWYEPVAGRYVKEGKELAFSLTPDSPITQLESFMALWEDADGAVRAAITEQEYNKIVAWWERAAMRSERDRWVQPQEKVPAVDEKPVSKWEQMAGLEGDCQPGDPLPEFPATNEVEQREPEVKAALLAEPVVEEVAEEALPAEPVIEEVLPPVESLEEDEDLGFGGAWD